MRTRCTRQTVCGFIVGVAASVLVALVLHRPTVLAQGQPAADATHGPTVSLDEREMRISYANAYRIHQSEEEVIADLGFNMPNPAAKGDANQPELLFRVNERVIMNYRMAKKLSSALQSLIQRYEAQFGEIPLQGPLTGSKR